MAALKGMLREPSRQKILKWRVVEPGPVEKHGSLDVIQVRVNRSPCSLFGLQWSLCSSHIKDLYLEHFVVHGFRMGGGGREGAHSPPPEKNLSNLYERAHYPYNPPFHHFQGTGACCYMYI